MPKFAYQAINSNGSTVSGELDAANTDAANRILTAKGYIPSKLKKAGSLDFAAGLKKYLQNFGTIKVRDIILFSQQLRTMLVAGVPILTLLEVMEYQTENPKLKQVMNEMIQDIKGGMTLYNAFRKHPKAFSPLYCSMIRSGETSGMLPDVLERLIYIIDHEHKTKSEIKSAMTYPMIVLVTLVGAALFLLTYVIPKFVSIFERAGLDLPLPTQIAISAYKFLNNYWLILLAAIVAGSAAFIWYIRTEQGRYLFHAAILRMPLLGQLLLKSAMSRFSSIFAILQASGVQILESVKILSGTIGNAAISREFDRLQNQLQEGRGISEPLRSGKYFTPMVVNMVALGEESGQLDSMLNEVSKHYDIEVEYGIKRLTEAIGPLLTVGLAGVVGFFAFAIFLPMWDLTKMAG